jgi:hypothetical protein
VKIGENTGKIWENLEKYMGKYGILRVDILIGYIFH